MKSRNALFGLFLAAVLLFSACSPQAESSEPVADDDRAAESSARMVEEEGMEEGEMKEEEGDMAESEDESMMEDMATVQFVVRIENLAPEGGLTILAPGAYELNDHPVAFFTPGEADRGLGLEALAEDGDPSILVAGIGEMMGEAMAGFAVEIFDTPVGAESPGPAGPGAAYEFTVEAYPGQYLTFATMFVHSNDWFFAPGAEGIALFDAMGSPISGDITDQIFLWNAGTEVDQTPGEGPDQAPRQAGPNTGADENGVVSLVEGFAEYQIRVTITSQQ